MANKPEARTITIIKKSGEGGTNEKPQWYALKTRSRVEKKLNERLNALGIETYLPLTREIKQWSDRRKEVEEPMFKGYLFVRTVSRFFMPALEQDGAVHFVKFNNQHAVIREDQIEFIRKVAENKLRFEVTEKTFEPGDKVEVINGPLKGFSGEWIKYKGKYNIAVHIKQLERIITVELPIAFVKKRD